MASRINSILALDLATSIGWSRWTSPAVVTYGTHRLPKTGGDVGIFFDAFESWLGDLLETDPVDQVVFEAPMVYEGTNQDTARKLIGLACFTEFICRRASIPSLECNVADVRSHFLGLGWGKHSLRRPNETKTWQTAMRMVADRCALRGWNPVTDDEGDSLALLDFAAHCLRGSVKVSWDSAPAGTWTDAAGRGWELLTTTYGAKKK